jgi:hypothetical protein
MGRTAYHAEDIQAPHKLRLQQCPLNQGGYDSGGAYWGTGLPIYRVADDDGDIEYWIRASDRDDAKATVREKYPNARFFR